MCVWARCWQASRDSNSSCSLALHPEWLRFSAQVIKAGACWGLHHHQAQEGIGVRFWHNKERIVLCPALLLQGLSGRRWNFAFLKVVWGEFSCKCSSCSCSRGLALRNVSGKTSVPCSQPLPTSRGGTGEPELEFLRQPPLRNIFRPSSHLIPTSSLIRARNITKLRAEITFDLKPFLIILHLA